MQEEHSVATEAILDNPATMASVKDFIETDTVVTSGAERSETRVTQPEQNQADHPPWRPERLRSPVI